MDREHEKERFEYKDVRRRQKRRKDLTAFIQCDEQFVFVISVVFVAMKESNMDLKKWFSENLSRRQALKAMSGLACAGFMVGTGTANMR